MPEKESQFFKWRETSENLSVEGAGLKEKNKSFDARAEKLSDFLEEIAGELRRDGVPVDAECRVDMKAFQGRYYSPEEVMRDSREITRIKERIRLEATSGTRKELSEEEFDLARKKSKGNKLERLKTAIFHKNLGPEFIVARSSSYDDIKGGVDNIILEKKTGNLVCAFDEVASRGVLKGDKRGRQIYEQKKKRILKKNAKGGASLKYGLKMEGSRPVPARVENIPIFYLALSPNTIELGINKFKPISTEQSELERTLFYSFVKSLRSQINFLVYTSKRALAPELSRSLLVFKASLERFSQNKEA